ncbi:MAG: redoxin domain-containing protein [Treponema sp.]|nr:redoxin domain-containing protein [Treponema sp.]
MAENLSILIVFTAGLLSFLSPCILPLVPSYLGILGGVGIKSKKSGGAADDNKTVSGRGDTGLFLWTAFGFILGFSAVFIVMGLLLNSVFFLLGGLMVYVNIAAGVIVIILGLNVIFDFLSFLNYEKRLFAGPAARPGYTGQANTGGASLRGLAAAFLGGAAFASGWTPCIGPVLTSVLLLAGQSGKTAAAVFYLVIYSAGLGIPFFLCALFFGMFVKFFAGIKKYLPLIRRISGILLIIIGIMILSGKYSALNGYLQKYVSNTAKTQETFPPETVKVFSDAGLTLFKQKVTPVDFALQAAVSNVPQTLAKPISLGGLKGKVVFLNFWATWCGPCRMEMPSIQALYDRYRDSGLEILAVNAGESRPEVQAFLDANKITFPVLLDTDNRVNMAYGVQAIPTSYLIDRDGMIIMRLTGSIDWNTPQIQVAIESILK